MNGAPGGSRQSEKAPPEGGPIRPPSVRAPTQQQQPSAAPLPAAAAIFPQVEEAGPSTQPGVAPPSQVFPLGAGVVQQAAALRESSATTFTALHSSAAQHPTGWPPQFDIQQLHSAQVAAAGLRYTQASTSQQPQPPSGTEMTVGASPLSSLPSPATPSASLLTGIGLGPGSGPSPSPAGQTPLQMLTAMNPALLAQYQVILAAAAQQQQVAAAAAASLAAASGGHPSQIGSRIVPPSTSSLSLEQNLQRYLLQLQQQQQQLAASAGAASHILPSSPLHGTSPLMAHMHAALAAVGVLPSPPAALTTHTTAPSAHSRVAPAALAQQPLPSPSAEPTSRPSRVEFLQPTQPLLSRVAAAAARQPPILAATATTTVSCTPLTSALQTASTSQPHSQVHGRVILMPPPSLPRARHASTQERRRYAMSGSRHAPYQRPTPVVPSSSAASTAAAAAATFTAPEMSSFQMGTLPSQPYYPSHFMRGTVIRLQSGQLKRVEEMNTEDFVLSAAMKTDLILCNSTVVRIQEIEKDRQVLVTFSVGEQGIQVTIEAGIEHPYFIVGQGWASCSPERTRSTYGLVCRQLNIGDVCITLRHIERGETSGTSSSGSDRQHSVRGGAATGPSSIHQSSRSTHSLQSPRRRSLPTLRVERRCGVKSAPPRESSSEECLLLDMRRRLRRRRRKSAL